MHVMLDVVHEDPPGDAVTLYVVIIEPPVDTGGCHDTSACKLPGRAVTFTGSRGGLGGGGEVKASSTKTWVAAAGVVVV